MEIVQVVSLGLLVTFLIVLIKQQRPDFAMFLSIVVGVAIFLMMLGKIEAVFNVLTDLGSRANVNMIYMGTVLKIIGIAYIAEFGAQVCRDAGEGVVATKIEFAAKIVVMVMAIPIILAILEALLKLIP
ncbi:MAG: stage III sporulation protein AD [Clostridia bacterium]|nr:stage III sporulation protein AD [Clostridia bacterium]